MSQQTDRAELIERLRDYPFDKVKKQAADMLEADAQPAVPQEHIADATRVLEWMRTPHRKPAQLAFTSGPERQAAYWIEIAQGEAAPQPQPAVSQEPVAWRYDIGMAVRENEYGCWKQVLTTHKPNVPPTSIRNLTPLYAAPQPAAPQEPIAWQPIETAPKDGTVVLVWPYFGEATTDCCMNESEPWVSDVTHWMQLPPAPDAAPQPQRPRLTPQEICELAPCALDQWHVDFARAIEKKVRGEV